MENNMNNNNSNNNNNKNKILCSTGALISKYNNWDYRLIEPLSEKLGCDAFEFMMYRAWEYESDELIQALSAMDVEFPAVHAIKYIGELISRGDEGDFDKAIYYYNICCKIAKGIGSGKLVLHLWGGMPSDNNFENNKAMYKELRAIADEYGIQMLVENVVCNNKDPMSRLLELFESYPDMDIVYDTKMAAFHEQLELIYGDDVRWMWRDGRIKHLHINDYNGGYMDWGSLAALPIGAGKIDFDTFFKFIKKEKYNGDFTIEATAFNTNGSIDTEMLNKCFGAVRAKTR